MFHDLSTSDGYRKALAEYGDYVSNSYPIQKSSATTIGRTFINEFPSHSVKSEYTRKDYEYYRAAESLPVLPLDIIRICMKAYEKVGIVYNIVNLMSDFGCQGIRLQHNSPRIEKFYQRWFEKVRGKERSERILNMLYRSGVAIIKGSYGKVNVYNEEEWKKSISSEDVELEKLIVSKRSVPLQYSILNPLSVEILGGDASCFVGKPIYALKISNLLRTQIKQLQSMSTSIPEAKSLLAEIPEYMKKAINSGKQYITLDQSKIFVAHYKKDDWDVWPKPMLYPIIDDLIMLDKMKLADISALDGAISNVRLWNVGVIGNNIQDSILPTKGMLEHVRNLLAQGVGGGTIDLVFGPEVKFTESSTKVHEFLGKGKYEPVWDAIYDGVGIPSILRSGGSSGTNANSFMALKTLVERLEYGRARLIEFWMNEIRIVQKAMGFRHPATVVFDQMVLADEAAMLALLVQLVDRNILSDDSILERFDFVPEIEKNRVKRQERNRTVKKASPYHNPQTDHDLTKIFAQGGAVTPSEVGLELEDRKEGEISRVEQQLELQKLDIENKAKLDRQKFSNQQNPSSGRPKNVVETNKRKPKSDTKPRITASFASAMLWANGAQNVLSEIVTPAFLGVLNKPSVRNLTKSEAQSLENMKFSVLCSIEPYSDINKKLVYNCLSKGCNIDKENIDTLQLLKGEFVLKNKREPNIDEVRQMQSTVYAKQYA